MESQVVVDIKKNRVQTSMQSRPWDSNSQMEPSQIVGDNSSSIRVQLTGFHFLARKQKIWIKQRKYIYLSKSEQQKTYINIYIILYEPIYLVFLLPSRRYGIKNKYKKNSILTSEKKQWIF